MMHGRGRKKRGGNHDPFPPAARTSGHVYQADDVCSVCLRMLRKGGGGGGEGGEGAAFTLRFVEPDEKLADSPAMVASTPPLVQMAAKKEGGKGEGKD